MTTLPHRRLYGISVRLTGIYTPNGSFDRALLVSPQGKKVLLYSGVANGAASSGATITFVDYSDSLPPGGLVSGFFKPSAYITGNLDPPAPAGPYATTLDSLTGAGAQGDWKLYIEGSHGYRVASGWGLDLITELVPAPTVSSTTPASPANNNSPKVKGSAEAGSTVYLFRDSGCTSYAGVGGSAAAFSSPGFSVPVADDTTTSFYAAIVDSHGNGSACSSTHVTYTEDSTVPTITIDSGPTGITDSPRFGFHSNDPGATLYCSLDYPATTFTPCTSPKRYPGLALGDHTFYVAAVDQAFNNSGATSRAFSVAPGTGITRHPHRTLRTRKSKAKAKFRFTSPGIAGASFACKIDGGPYRHCHSPKTLHLRPGRHTFRVRATASGLTDPTPAKFKLKVKRRRH